MVIVIMAGGPPELLPDLDMFKEKADLWAGADRGVQYLLERGIVPDAAFGDFDSVTEEELFSFRNRVKDISIYPPEKDETDLELAFNWAAAQNPDEVWVLGATGGRLDHFLASLQLFLRSDILPMHQTAAFYLADKNNTARVVMPGSFDILFDPAKKYISFLPASKCVEGLTLEGFKYPLDHTRLPAGSTLCISNELISEAGHFSFSSGILMVVRSSD